jgi:fructose-1-phosphate kinase PfkB-like protein
MVMIVITVVPFLDLISMLRVTKSNPGKASQLHKNRDTAIAGGVGLSSSKRLSDGGEFAIAPAVNPRERGFPSGKVATLSGPGGFHKC